MSATGQTRIPRSTTMSLYGAERVVRNKRDPSSFRPIDAGSNGFPPFSHGRKRFGTNTASRGTLGHGNVSSCEEKESQRQCLYFKF
jgi:hypothetical protein